MSWFKKKEKTPPLPENLPPLEDIENTHDQIPNDFEAQGSEQTYSEAMPNINQDLDQETSPLQEDYSQEMEQPQQDYEMEEIPNAEPELPDLPEPSEPQLPELPDLPDEESMQKPVLKKEKIVQQPLPDNEDVPEPPPIFSDEGFYETPEEVKHMVDERKVQRTTERSVDRSYEAPGIGSTDESMKPAASGPIFVDIEAFKTMLSDIDTIKNDMKSSSIVMQHLEEIKNSKDRELERWRTQLEDIQRKINYVDKILFMEN
ncbi:hypothetical protein H6503_00560 [Candidatus Woesearchaeota archaeon]|nr:hypothetical protein [Candidatus Woesearchaeota archaeon]